MTLATLLLPHANIRYRQSVRSLSFAELSLLAKQLPGAPEPRWEECGGLSLLCLDVRAEDVADALRLLCVHSSCQAVFSLEGEVLRPLPLPALFSFDEDIAAILKYKGKTNERFTSLLTNVALFSGNAAKSFDGKLALLDPMCGRGTTLLEGLRRGYNVGGVELDKTDTRELQKFLKQYLTYHKLKHKLQQSSLTKAGKHAGERYLYTLEEAQTLTLIHGDTLHADAFFKPATFDALAADLPYGVQHTSLEGQKRAKLDELMRRALPLWLRLLKPGAGIALSFNAHAIGLPALRALLTDAGFAVCEGGPYEGFRHWVEQAVDRDIVAATRPVSP